jgi:hypothetical protein
MTEKKYNSRGGRPPVSENETQSFKKLLLNLSKKEFEKLEKNRAKFHLTRSDYIRYKLFDKKSMIRKSNIDYRNFRIELNRIGVNLNQIAKHLNSDGPEFVEGDTKKTFNELIDVLVDVSMNIKA